MWYPASRHDLLLISLLAYASTTTCSASCTLDYKYQPQCFACAVWRHLVSRTSKHTCMWHIKCDPFATPDLAQPDTVMQRISDHSDLEVDPCWKCGEPSKLMQYPNIR